MFYIEIDCYTMTIKNYNSGFYCCWKVIVKYQFDVTLIYIYIYSLENLKCVL